VRERELKLVVEPSFEVPPLDDAVPGAVLDPPRVGSNHDIYHDTDDLRLVRWGVTLRWRDGTGWTVKLPNPRTGAALDRDEIVVAGEAGSPPPEARDLVASFTRGAPLIPVAEITTARTARIWHRPDGSPVAELADDEVAASVLVRPAASTGADKRGSAASAGAAGARKRRRAASTARFREIEVELAPDADGGLLEDLAGLLGLDRAPAAQPKLARVLGPAALERPDVWVGELGPEPSGAAVIQAAIAASVERLVRHLPLVRVGVDPEGVHQARVATRRLRSDLQTFGPLLEAAWTSKLRAELAWLATELGVVRDADVLDGLLRSVLAGHPEIDAAAGERILAVLARQREDNRRQLLAHLGDARTFTLLDHLVAAATAPHTRPAADGLARTVLPPLVKRKWRKLHRAVKALPVAPPIDDLHQIRILSKRVRYASEAVAPAVGRPAARFAAQAAIIQDVLGELNDAEVAGRRLASVARTLRGPAAFAAGRLAQQLAAEAGLQRPADDGWREAYNTMRSRPSWLRDQGSS
jgi:CHAD domain-containing protein